MRCKPMDLAIVTSTPGGGSIDALALRECVGRVVRVTRCDGNTIWDIEEALHASVELHVGMGVVVIYGVLVHGIGDEYLTPLPTEPVTEDVEDEVTA